MKSKKGVGIVESISNASSEEYDFLNKDSIENVLADVETKAINKSIIKLLFRYHLVSIMFIVITIFLAIWDRPTMIHYKVIIIMCTAFHIRSIMSDERSRRKIEELEDIAFIKDFDGHSK